MSFHHKAFQKPKRGRVNPNPTDRTRHDRLKAHFARLRAKDKRDQKELDDGLDRALAKDE